MMSAFPSHIRTRFSEEQNWFMIIQRKEGYSNSTIAQLFQERYERCIDPKSVERVFKRFKETGSIQERARPGRPRAFKPDETQMIIESIENTPIRPMREILSDVEEKIRPADVKTVRRVLKENGIKAYSIKKSEISEINRKKRVVFAREGLEKSKDYWESMLFSDESDLFSVRTQPLIFRRKADQIVQVPHEPSYAGKAIKVWGFISAEGVGKLVRYEGNVNWEKYQEIH